MGPVIHPGPADIIRRIHSGPGARVIFHGEGLKELGALPAEELAERWTAVEPHLAGEAYFSLSSGWGGVERKDLATGLWCGRKASDLRWLNALFVDIDAHDLHELDQFDDKAANSLLQDALNVVSAKGVPRPNFVAESGRGWWLIWLFTEPLRAWPEKVDLWRRAARKLLEMFQSEGLSAVDPSCVDPCRLVRIPGSLNRKAGKRVRFYQISEKRYPFLELATVLGVKAQKTALPGGRKPVNPNRINCRLGRWRRTMAGLEKLIITRGKVAEGMRSTTIFYIAMAMRGMDSSYARIVEKCMLIGSKFCSPPMEKRAVHKALNSGRARRVRLSLATLRKALGVTKAELAKIPELRPLAEIQQSKLSRKARALERKKRTQSAMRALVARSGSYPSVREMVGKLKDMGLSCSVGLASQYMNEIRAEVKQDS